MPVCSSTTFYQRARESFGRGSPRKGAALSRFVCELWSAHWSLSVLSIFGVWLGHQFVGYQKIVRIIKFESSIRSLNSERFSFFFCFTPAITGDRLARRFRRRPLLLSSTRNCLPIATERLLESLGSAALPSQGSTALTMFTMQFPCSTISPMLAANLFSPAIHKELLFINLP